MKIWVCTVCNYEHVGEEPPEICPVCGAGREAFELKEQTDDEEVTRKSGMPATLEEVRNRAREIMKGVCAVYPRCDGLDDRVCQRQAYGGIIGMGGVGSGRSFSANVEALGKIQLRTRLVGPHFEPDTTFDFFGQVLSAPILGSSTSGVSSYKDSIDEYFFCHSCLQGCLDAGSLSWRGDTHFYTETDHPGLKSIEELSGGGVQIFKPRAQDVLKRLIERAEKAGCPAVGVDLDGCGSTNMARAGQPVYRKSPEDIEQLVKSTSLPFITKGLMDADDAELCVQAGVQVIAVSNHGGRVLDSTPGVATVLPDIKARVGGRAMITADGGVRTGFDALKLLALGADAVLIGRDLVRAAVGGGSYGVKLHMNHVIKTLRHGLLMTGCENLAAVNRDIIYREA